MSHARKLRRAAAVKAVPVDDETPPLARVGMLAGISLGLSDEQATDALNALAGFREGDGTSATMFARMLELVDLARSAGVGDALQTDLDTTRERAKLERSFGAGFTKRVAAMGSPAVSMLGALRSLLLLAVLLLWPSTAKAAAQELADAYSSAHKIQRRNSRLRRKIATVNRPSYHRARGWIRSKRSYATSRPRSSLRPRFATGCAFERASYVSRAPATSRSYWSGGGEFSESGPCPKGSRTSLSDATTERSSSRRTPEVTP